MKITEQLILEGRSDRGGWSRQQLELLGVAWPPLQGWKTRIIGKSISTEKAKQFVVYRAAHELLTPARNR